MQEESPLLFGKEGDLGKADRQQPRGIKKGLKQSKEHLPLCHTAVWLWVPAGRRVSLCSHHSLTASSPLPDGLAFILACMTHTSFSLWTRQTFTDTAGPLLVLAALFLFIRPGHRCWFKPRLWTSTSRLGAVLECCGWKYSRSAES